MKKKKETVDMELNYVEKGELREITDSRQALVELQAAVIPYAKELAKRQRLWWDKVLGDRGLTRDMADYTSDGTKIIGTPKDKEG